MKRCVAYRAGMASTPLTTRPPPGRPRDLRAKRAVLDAARTLIEKDGYPAATIEAISARAGVAKTTIYRWWPNRSALAVDLLIELVESAAPTPEGGDPILMLRDEMALVARAMDSLPGRLAISLLGEAEHDPYVHNAMLRGIFNPRRQARVKIVRRAQALGLLRSDLPPVLAVDLLYGPLFYRSFIRHEGVTGNFARQVFEYVLGGLRPQPARRKTRPAPSRPRRSAR